MLRTIKSWLIGSVLATCALSVAQAQTPQPAAPERFYSQQELDQMLAPIALYPDPLLTQILMASTYPLEVVRAARWSRAYPQLQGDDAVRAVVNEDWDPSVKSLVAFPRVLAMMDERIDWTEQLGEAFLAQEPYVLETVQALRRRAYAAGNLESNADVLVAQEDNQLVVQPADPRVVYVPYYDPWVVYGTWWWPGYPPVYWAPWPGYAVRPGVSVGIYWGSGISLSTGFFFGAFDWHRRHVDTVYVTNYYYRPRVSHNVPLQWRHDVRHRRGVDYRHEELRERYPQPVTRAAPRRTEPRRTEPPRYEPQPGRPQPRTFEPRRDAPQQRATPQHQPAPQFRQRPAPQTQQRPAPQTQQQPAPQTQQQPAPQTQQRPAPRRSRGLRLSPSSGLCLRRSSAQRRAANEASRIPGPNRRAAARRPRSENRGQRVSRAPRHPVTRRTRVVATRLTGAAATASAASARP